MIISEVGSLGLYLTIVLRSDIRTVMPLCSGLSNIKIPESSMTAPNIFFDLCDVYISANYGFIKVWKLT